MFLENGEVIEVRLPPPAPVNQVTAAVALSPTQSIAVTADGRVFTTDAGVNRGGIAAGTRLNGRIVGLGIYWSRRAIAASFTVTADEWEPSGYWLLGSDGGVFAFGTAAYHGSTGAMKRNQPVVGITTTPTGDGYWLIAGDGGVFTFGDARFLGSGTGAGKSFVGATATATGLGYTLLAADGTTVAFGDAS